MICLLEDSFFLWLKSIWVVTIDVSFVNLQKLHHIEWGYYLLLQSLLVVLLVEGHRLVLHFVKVIIIINSNHYLWMVSWKVSTKSSIVSIASITKSEDNFLVVCLEALKGESFSLIIFFSCYFSLSSSSMSQFIGSKSKLESTFFFLKESSPANFS